MPVIRIVFPGVLSVQGNSYQDVLIFEVQGDIIEVFNEVFDRFFSRQFIVYKTD